ncbi:MAG: MoaD/ThiS family protein [Methanosarcinales archaeon]|nr:MoaD/ThiS family protein [Methanosarcinales archaeon]
MKIKVKAFAGFRNLLGREREVTLEEGCTLRTLLEGLFSPPHRDRMFSGDGQLRDDVNVLRNGQNVLGQGGLEMALADGDEIAVIPAVIGG